jgi:hypothetical protein
MFLPKILKIFEKNIRKDQGKILKNLEDFPPRAKPTLGRGANFSISLEEGVFNSIYGKPNCC